MTLTENSISIDYPPLNPGTSTTKILFHHGEADLTSLFNPGKSETQKRCFITDATVATLPCMQNFASKFDDGKCGADLLIILGSGEPYKTLESVLTIIETALEAGFTRNDLFVGIGGGVITDLTGFAASIFKRGAKTVFIPTTLLAMVDASVGGKTGTDFKNYKNMIGSFFPAAEIHYFPEFINSLSTEQYRSGLAESLKTALLFDKELYEIFKMQGEKILSRDKDTVFDIIKRCASAKAKIVEQDLTEKNIRRYLNLGHTFAHALETVAGLGTISHGDAVAWGIGREACLAAKLEFCSENFKDEILLILEKYGWNTSPIPNFVSGGGIGERLLNVMHKDKKNKTDKISIVLQKNICDTFIQEIEDEKILMVLK